MRIGLALILGMLFLASCRVPPSAPATADGSKIPLDYAVFSWKDEKDFKRISEYFTNEENSSGNCIVRTDPETRDGLYLILAIDSSEEIPAGSKAELRYFRPDKVGEQVRTFELPEFSGTLTNEIRLGLTGEAWPKTLKKNRPSAWKLSIYAPDGTLLVCRESFLWHENKNK